MGQNGPLARTAGHDITYLALTGALAALEPAGGVPTPPLDLVGDLGGGSLFPALGIAAALFERERKGAGEVIDAAIVDGVASIMSFYAGLSVTSALSMERDPNPLAGANPFYRCYECADGRYVDPGALEPQFRSDLLRRIGAPADLADAAGPDAATALSRIFAGRSRDAGAALLEGTDACLAPVLTLGGTPAHPHLAACATFVNRDGKSHPAPVPRLSRSALRSSAS